MDDDPLIVPANDLLKRRKIQSSVVVGHPVVEAKHERLELGDDAVLVIARISDQSARAGFVAGLLR